MGELVTTSGLSALNKDQIAERGARMARREEREYWPYLNDEQRRQTGAPAARSVRGGVKAGCPAREVVVDQRGQATRGGRHAARTLETDLAGAQDLRARAPGTRRHPRASGPRVRPDRPCGWTADRIGSAASGCARSRAGSDTHVDADGAERGAVAHHHRIDLS